MTDMTNSPSFFLGANSAAGFFPYFEQAYQPEDGWRLIILKGGPGTGKSSFMKRFAQCALENGEPLEQIYCSSDPSSLDAVLLPNRKIGIVDGTSPHTMDPKYPGASETIINMGEYWDATQLEGKAKEIIAISNQCSGEHARSQRYLRAAGALLEDTYQYALSCTDQEKLEKYVDKTVRRLFLPECPAPKESIRFLSGITPDGVIFFEGTPTAYGTRCFCIEDDYGPVSNLFLSFLRARLLKRNAAFISCYQPLFPTSRLEAIILPDAGVTFLAVNSRKEQNEKPYKTIHAKRFMDTERLSLRRQRLNFTKKAAQELIQEGVRCLQNAKAIHDKLETLYIQAMDFQKAEEKMQSVLLTVFPK